MPKRWLPTKLNAERMRAIVHGVALGMALSAAAGLADVDEKTARRWRDRGRDVLVRIESGEEITETEQKYAEFAQSLIAAESKREAVMLNRLQQASIEGDAQTTRWLLSVTNPDRYSKAAMQVNQVVNNAVAVSTDRAESMSDQQIEARLVELRLLQEGGEDGS